jgi:triosephosphate isomerase (TIM)
MTRIPLVSGNWKMNLNHFEAIQLVQKLSYELSHHDFEQVEVTVHPPFTDIRSVQTVIDADRMKFDLGAQNCHMETSGAFTGEVSPMMLAKLQVHYVIVGHSERRALFGETDEIVAAKAKAGEAKSVVESQVRGSLDGLTNAQVAQLVIAYEPVWAIGTGLTASAQDAQEMCAHIRQVVESMVKDAGDTVRIQYGGSVKPTNAKELLTQPDIDGALVGGAALEAESFARIVMFKDQ